MDQRQFRRLELAGVLVVAVLILLGHFLYEWTGENRVVALFCAVNESVWEHVKIIYFPYLFYTAAEFLLLRPAAWVRFLAAKLTGLLSIPVLLISFYYTYTGILGFRIEVVDIASAFLWAVLAFVISYRLFYTRLSVERAILWVGVGSSVFTVLLLVFTYFPPHIPLFLDISTGRYGIGSL